MKFPAVRSSIALLLRSAVIAVTLGVIAVAVINSPARSATKRSLDSISSRLPFISLGEFLYRREPRDYSEDGRVKAAWKVLTELESPELDVAALSSLTSHDDASIRALALLGLVAKETREVFPCCVKLLNDKATVMPRHMNYNTVRSDHSVHTDPLTVGKIAQSVLDMAGCRMHGNKDGLLTISPDPDTWWKLRKDNPDWLGWLGYLYLRASQGTRPPQDAARAAIQRFRKQVDAMPPATRAWTLLFLADDVLSMNGLWANYYATEEEMIAAVQALGPERLLEFLRSGKREGLKNPSLDDPKRGTRFIVRYAPRFFGKQHAAALLELKQFTASADADPSIVRSAIEDAMCSNTNSWRGWERGRAMATLAALGNEEDRQTAVRWFGSEPNSSGGSSPQGEFIRELRRRRPAEWRSVVKGIVAHESFDRLRPLDVVYFAQMVEDLGGEKVGQPWEGNADELRERLRSMFNVHPVEIPVLQIPTNNLSGPAWTKDFEGKPQSLFVSDDGQLLAVDLSDTNKGMLVLSAKDGQLMPEGQATARFPGKTEGLVVVLGENTTGLHDRKLGKRWEKKQRTVWFTPNALSPDGKWLALTVGWGPQIELLNAKNGSRQFLLEGLSSEPKHLIFSPDSNLLLAVGDDSRLVFWRTSDGTIFARYRGANQYMPEAFSTDTKFFYAGKGNETVVCYDVRGAVPQFAVKVSESGAMDFSHMELSRDGRHIYVICRRYPPDERPVTWHQFVVQCWDIPQNQQ